MYSKIKTILESKNGDLQLKKDLRHDFMSNFATIFTNVTSIQKMKGCHNLRGVQVFLSCKEGPSFFDPAKDDVSRKV